MWCHSFALLTTFFPTVVQNGRGVLIVYLCLGPPNSLLLSLNLVNLKAVLEKVEAPDEQSSPPRSAHHLLTPNDVHPSCFASRFRNLMNVTNANMPGLMGHLAGKSKGLASGVSHIHS
ncbi:hypothetical protein P879_00217 [Paragonimus westermani]|uniref:Uncharacterized protein n=1 Tax=Paragonimus westermani TaxID=34504 RepID=A0A8T0DVG3_9TREM|nr:hypothetical protein P879_00217 [Paragonimus westermani]